MGIRARKRGWTVSHPGPVDSSAAAWDRACRQIVVKPDDIVVIAGRRRKGEAVAHSHRNRGGSRPASCGVPRDGSKVVQTGGGGGGVPTYGIGRKRQLCSKINPI